MRRFIFYWFTFKLVCCCGPCPCFTRKCYPERTIAQGSTCYKYWQPSSFFIATVHQHPFTGKVASKTSLRGRGEKVSLWCQWYKRLRMSLVDVDEKGERQGLLISSLSPEMVLWRESNKYSYKNGFAKLWIRSASWWEHMFWTERWVFLTCFLFISSTQFLHVIFCFCLIAEFGSFMRGNRIEWFIAVHLALSLPRAIDLPFKKQK